MKLKESSGQQPAASSQKTTVRTYKDLRVWQGGCELAAQVYKTTASFPKAETFGLTSQMRRAAASIPANIAEGHARQYDTEFVRYLFIALGSLAELETYAYLAVRLEYLSTREMVNIEQKSSEVGRMLNGLIARIKRQGEEV